MSQAEDVFQNFHMTDLELVIYNFTHYFYTFYHRNDVITELKEKQIIHDKWNT
jgi:hypothetical protein